MAASTNDMAQRLAEGCRTPAVARTPALRLTTHVQIGREHVPYVRRHLKRVIPLLASAPETSGFLPERVSLVFAGDAAVRRLHRQFMNDPSTTDVITFPLEIDDRGRVVEGEIVVCVPTARRAVRRIDVPAGGLPAGGEDRRVSREILLYALHGLLHLCGYDDQSADEYAQMHAREDELLTRLGIGPVFAPERPPSVRTVGGGTSAAGRVGRHPGSARA